MYSELLLDHFRHPRHVGVVDSPDAEVEVSNPACGDTLHLSVRMDGARIREARYQTRGCTAAIACGSVLAEWLTGKNCEELPRLSAAQVSALVGNLAPASQHAAVLCVDGALALFRRLSPPREKLGPSRVFDPAGRP